MHVVFCDKSSPFIDYYEKNFSRALDEGNFSVLDSTIQSLYLLCNDCLSDVVIRLTDLAMKAPDNDFVESFLFFIDATMTSNNTEKIISLISDASLTEKLAALASHLDDEDLRILVMRSVDAINLRKV